MEYSQPLELIEFTEAFRSLANEFSHHISAQSDGGLPDGVRLHIAEIRRGSIAVDLIPYISAALFAADINTIINFYSHIKNVFDGLLSQDLHSAKDLPVSSIENAMALTYPTCNDEGSQISVSVVNNGVVNGNLHVTLNATQAASAHRKGALEISSRFESPTQNHHTGKLLHWYQTRNDAKGDVGDRAIIEDISDKPVKTAFCDPAVKARILGSANNPYRRGYIVDVTVQTIGRIPKLYTIEEVTADFELDTP